MPGGVGQALLHHFAVQQMVVPADLVPVDFAFAILALLFGQDLAGVILAGGGVQADLAVGDALLAGGRDALEKVLFEGVGVEKIER